MATCKHCSKEFAVGRNTYGIYCSNKCQQTQQQYVAYIAWKAGDVPSRSTRTLAGWLRKFEGNKCSVCNITEWNKEPLNMQCDHIDGNPSNDSYNNIRLVCPNCDAQSNTYKNKNYGNGRHSRRLRYAEGKSY